MEGANLKGAILNDSGDLLRNYAYDHEYKAMTAGQADSTTRRQKVFEALGDDFNDLSNGKQNLGNKR